MPDTAGVYRHIIDDVVTRVRTEFVQEGVDEAVLDELRELWETKLLASGVLEPVAPAPQAPLPNRGPVPQYFQPSTPGGYAGAPAYNAASVGYDSQLGKPETFLQPTGFAGFPTATPTLPPPRPFVPPQQQQQQQHPVQQQQTHQQPQAHAYTAAPMAQSHAAAPLQQPAATAAQQPQPPQQSQAQARPAAPAQPAHPGGAAPAASPAATRAPPAGSHAALPQQPPQAQAQQPQPQQQQGPPAASAAQLDTRKRPLEGPGQGGPQKQPYRPAELNGVAAAPMAAPGIPQVDGNDDEASPVDASEAFQAEDEGSDPLAGLSSDDDAEGDDIPNVVLAQFEKVSRTKTKSGTKWKCQLKNGIAHLGGRDIIFKRCNGEMEF